MEWAERPEEQWEVVTSPAREEFQEGSRPGFQLSGVVSEKNSKTWLYVFIIKAVPWVPPN